MHAHHIRVAVVGFTLALIVALSASVRADDVGFGFALNVGGSHDEWGWDIAVDDSGNVHVVGSYQGTADFNPGSGVTNLSALSFTDIFVAKYDASGNFLWARSMGGTGGDAGAAIAVDATGNVYTTGTFIGTADFNPGSGTSNLISAGNLDVFVSKLNSSGNFVWARRLGGDEQDASNDIKLDGSGNVYIAGVFDGTADFNPGGATENLVSTGEPDIFVSKLTSSGNYVWAKSIASTDGKSIGSLFLDASSNVFIAGGYIGTVDFNPNGGVDELSTVGGTDAFVCKWDSGGNYVWASSMGGSFTDFCRTVAVGASGGVYTTGSFRTSADFDPGDGEATLTGTLSDVFWSKLSASGNYVWAKNMGTFDGQSTFDLALDAAENVYTTGEFAGTLDFDPGEDTVEMTSVDSWDVFVHKLDSAGDYVWTKQMGGTDWDSGQSIALDAMGNVYTTGWFWGSGDYNPGSGTTTLTSVNPTDLFISKLTSLTRWVDFGYAGSEDGSYDKPFNLLAEGVAAVPVPGTVMIKGDTGDAVSSESSTITQAVTLEAVNGAVRIGDLGGRSVTGFVSRD